MPKRIISGGQTGVDRAALDVALELGIPCGGWCPLGRRAEDGPIPNRYPLQETPTDKYPQRTRWNVRDSDGTLILEVGAADRGTKLTHKLARQQDKVLLAISLDAPLEVHMVVDYLDSHQVQTLNIAGPRESSHPGIYERARDYLRQVLSAWRESGAQST